MFYLLFKYIGTRETHTHTHSGAAQLNKYKTSFYYRHVVILLFFLLFVFFLHLFHREPAKVGDHAAKSLVTYFSF